MTNIQFASSTIRPQISDRFMRELPRFFGEGVVSILREAFQNAYRAGAKTVNVTHGDGYLTIEDDGCGLDDPQLLLTGGATGWNETEVVEPAGLGVFSYLNKALTDCVVFMSHNWRVTLRPDVLDTPLSEIPVVATEHPIRGMQVTIALQPGVKVEKKDIIDAYGFFEFLLYENGSRVLPREEPRVRAIARGLGHLDMVGRVSPGDSSSKVYIAWEGQAIHDELFQLYFNKAKKAHGLQDDTGYGNGSLGFVWTPERGTALRPKLPDRRSFISDAATADLMEVAANALAKEMAARQRVVALDTLTRQGEVLKHDALLSIVGKLGLKQQAAFFAREAGYFYCKGGYDLSEARYDEPTITIESGDSDNYYEGIPTAQAVWSRRPLKISDEYAALTLNTLYRSRDNWGELATEPEDGLPLEIEVDGGLDDIYALDKLPIALVKSIRVGDIELPYLLREEMPYVLFAKGDLSDAEAIEAAASEQELQYYIFAQIHDDWSELEALANGGKDWDFSDGSVYVRPEQLEDEIVLRMKAQYLVPATVVEEYRLNKDRIERLENALEALGGRYGTFPAVLRPAADAINATKAEVRSAQAALEAQYPHL